MTEADATNPKRRAARLRGRARTANARRRLLLTLVCALLPVAVPASAQVPTRVPFQGLLLDAGGEPVNASIDLDFALFDALTGGTPLWSESQLGVIVVDGVYSVDLGATVPLTNGVLVGGARFLEITVSGETLVPRQQLLSVPYALVAEDASALGGVTGVFFQQMIAGFPFDGAPPANDHPDEGVVDTDGDGTPNFLDSDNDDDGISDATELAAGSAINVVTPRITSVTPNPARSFFATTLVVAGTHLDGVSSVSFGVETPTPTSVTPNGFQVDVTTETLVGSQELVVLLANGERDAESVGIQAVAPTITGLVAFVEANQPQEIEITGTGFYPGTTVQIGTQNLVPSLLSETSLSVSMAPEPIGSYPLTVIHPNTLTASSTLIVTPEDGQRRVFVSASTSGVLGGLAGADALCQAEADAQGLPSGSYLAWLSDGVESPSTRFDQTQGPYVLPNGTVVALDWTDLTDGTLDSAINVTAENVQIFDSFVWTGTNEDGTPSASASPDCDDWTNASAPAVYGRVSQPSGLWSGFGTANCSVAARLYCFQN